MEIAALILVLVMLGVAYIAFKVLKKSVRLVFRLVLVFFLLLAAAVVASTMLIALR